MCVCKYIKKHQYPWKLLLQMDNAFSVSGVVLYSLFHHFQTDPQFPYTYQRAHNKAKAASMVNIKVTLQLCQNMFEAQIDFAEGFLWE